MIKLLTFDLDNTLWEIDPVIIEAEKAIHQSHLLPCFYGLAIHWKEQ